MKHEEVITTHEYEYTAVFEPAEEGGYVVHFPALRGCVTQGETLEEARYMAADALQCYLESLAMDGAPFPVEEVTSEPVRERVKVALKTV